MWLWTIVFWIFPASVRWLFMPSLSITLDFFRHGTDIIFNMTLMPNYRDTGNMLILCAGMLRVSFWLLLVKTRSGCGHLVQGVKLNVCMRWAVMGASSIHVFSIPLIHLCLSLAATRQVLGCLFAIDFLKCFLSIS